MWIDYYEFFNRFHFQNELNVVDTYKYIFSHCARCVCVCLSVFGSIFLIVCVIHLQNYILLPVRIVHIYTNTYTDQKKYKCMYSIYINTNLNYMYQSQLFWISILPGTFFKWFCETGEKDDRTKTTTQSNRKKFSCFSSRRKK